MKLRCMRLVAPVLLLLSGCSGDLSIEDAWIRALPPGAGMTAGYLVLSNTASTPVTLTGASSDAFNDVSLHETRVAGGISRMRHIEAFVVPANSTVEFAPGGRHLMLMGPSRSLAEGDKVQITLHFADRIDLTLAAEVRSE